MQAFSVNSQIGAGHDRNFCTELQWWYLQVQIWAEKNPQKGRNPILPATFCSADDLLYLPAIRRKPQLRTELVFTGDNDPDCNIWVGQLKLLGSNVARFFEPSVECIVKAVLDQCKVAHKPISVSHFCFTLWCYSVSYYMGSPNTLNQWII